MRSMLIATAITSLLFLTACGQKGPLYIPQKPVLASETGVEADKHADFKASKR